MGHNINLRGQLHKKTEFTSFCTNKGTFTCLGLKSACKLQDNCLYKIKRHIEMQQSEIDSSLKVSTFFGPGSLGL